MSDEYLELVARQKATHLAIDVDGCTRLFPKNETCGLCSQMRQAAFSVPANIAKGRGQGSRKDSLQFLLAARGSLLALDTQLSVAFSLEYIDLQMFETLRSETEELRRILSGLINRFQVLPQEVPGQERSDRGLRSQEQVLT